MTPLQILIEQLRQRLNSFPDDLMLSERGLYDGYLNAMNMATKLLETEKQQIVDAYTNGQIDIAKELFEVILKNDFKGEIPSLVNDKEDGKNYYNNLIKQTI